MTEIKVIQNDQDHAQALAQLERLILADRDEDVPVMDALALLIDAYERKKFPIPALSPIEMIQFRMEQQNMSQAALARDTKIWRSHISEILNGHRGLSYNAIQKLHTTLDIPYAAFFDDNDQKAE
ncbi:helix-turn-helix domain-containing protein [Hwanghaeella sp. LZ110]|uniref:helix-turn-helix domain-containing protein n=1 Tax=Hwanghaeella sp. LZ110 TaxID=3402810 RepID=UPI003B6816F4